MRPASIDNETDAAIQRQIRDGFVGSTTITIAHRLHTILDSDRVLVLDDGKVLEYDAPATLLADSASRFRALVDAAKGRSPSQQNLLQLAEDEASARAVVNSAAYCEAHLARAPLIVLAAAPATRRGRRVLLERLQRTGCRRRARLSRRAEGAVAVDADSDASKKSPCASASVGAPAVLVRQALRFVGVARAVRASTQRYHSAACAVQGAGPRIAA